jgi:hypothetical protein
VQAEPRYTLCLSVDEFIKQYDQYGVPFDADFIEYLRGLSFSERQAFNMAMGYVFGKISDLDLKLPSSGLYLLVKATDGPAEPFYNAHRDRRDLFGSRVEFGAGWYAVNHTPRIARWMNKRSRLVFETTDLARIRLELMTHMPELRSQPIELKFVLNGESVGRFSLFEYDWLTVEMEVPEELSSPFELDIHASRTWQPALHDPQSSDDRHLSIAVCNIEFIP